MSASTPILRANHHTTKETIKTNKKRYKQGKVIAKGKLYVRQTQKVRMKDNQENKEHNEKSRHTKEYLRKSTRVDEENKILATGNFFFFMQTVLDIHWFNWNVVERTGLWNLYHRNFKMLTQYMHWNQLKTVSQLREINFLKSLPDYRIFFGRNVHSRKDNAIPKEQPYS